MSEIKLKKKIKNKKKIKKNKDLNDKKVLIVFKVPELSHSCSKQIINMFQYLNQ